MAEEEQLVMSSVPYRGGYKQVCWCPDRTAAVHARQLCVCVCVCARTLHNALMSPVYDTLYM